MSISAKVICHSKAPNGEELITMEVEFHRFILAEINTHRVLSRNYQSSRAVPVDKMIEQVRNDPAIPIHFGLNQRGMIAEEENNKNVSLWVVGIEGSAEDAWRMSARHAANYAECFHEAKYHKQVVNRILEPYIWTKGVITGTLDDWNKVFKLRCHKDAQPEFKALADKIRTVIDISVPNELSYGEYHLPYVDYKNSSKTLEDNIKIATSCTAQVSYRVLDDSLEKALKLYEMLNLPEGGIYKEDPPHFSPTEHCAKVVEDYKFEDFMGGNFSTNTFWQYRKSLEIGAESKFIGSGK